MCLFGRIVSQKVMVINMCDKIWQQLVYNINFCENKKPVPITHGVLYYVNLNRVRFSHAA